MLDLAEIRVFAKVAELKSMSAAGRALRLPRSTVSRDVARLETALGARLLQRTTRKIGLTDAGSAFQKHCERILAAVEDAERAIADLQSAPRGHLRVSAPIALGQTVLGPWVAEFLKRFPEIVVTLELDNRRIDLVGEEFDVAIRIGPLPDSALVARRLTTTRSRLCASPAYAEDRQLPTSPDDLAGHATLAMQSPEQAWVLKDRAGATRKVPIQPRVVTNDPGVLRQAVLGGAGLAWLPDLLCAEDLAQGRLLEADLGGWAPARAEIHVLFATHRSMSPKVRSFIDELARRLAPDA